MREEKGAFKYKVQKLGRGGEELWIEEKGGSAWLMEKFCFLNQENNQSRSGKWAKGKWQVLASPSL